MSIDLSLAPWTAIEQAVMAIINKVWPDPAAQAEAARKMAELKQTGALAELTANLQIALAQAQTNQIEAAQPNWFRAGWRPMVGWICSMGLLYQFLLQPLLAWGSSVGHFPGPPQIELGSLLTLLMGMLGLGTLRTMENAKGVDQ
jgi:hypothetical protein